MYVERIKREIKAVTTKAVEDGKYDFYFNRLRERDGMVNANIIDLFKMHGFDVYGGKDYEKTMCNMKFAVDMDVAIKMARSNNIEERKAIWAEHVKKCRQSLKEDLLSRKKTIDTNITKL